MAFWCVLCAFLCNIDHIAPLWVSRPSASLGIVWGLSKYL